MNHLEESKKKLIDRIQEMSVEEYEELTAVLFQNPEQYHKLFAPGILFICDDCLNTYGKCHVKDGECTERFQKYMSGDAAESK